MKPAQLSVLASDSNTERFPIRVLSEQTGVGTSTLRAWERRYGLLTPERTPKGHRLYSDSDVRLVEYILTLLEEGHSLPSIARLIKQGPVGPDNEQGKHEPEQIGIWRDYVSATLRAVRDFSTERLEAVYNEASSLYPVDMVTECLIEPVLDKLGKDWQSRKAGIAEEHFYASWVRNRLGARFHHAFAQASGTRILCVCAPGAYHEIGLMLFSLAALMRGYRVLYLGADLPLTQIPAVVERSGVRGVVLSSRTEVNTSLHRELAALSRQLDVPVLLGGLSSDQPLTAFEQAGGVRLGSRIAVALKVLGTHVPPLGGESRSLNRVG